MATLAQAGRPPTPRKFAFEAAPDRVATYASVLAAVDDPDCVILDNRSAAEYAGEDRRARHGGAVPSARHCDRESLFDHATGRMLPADALRAVFESHGATPDKNITLYCNTGYRSAHACLALRRLGYPHIRNYVGSWQEWGNRDGLPIWRPSA